MSTLLRLTSFYFLWAILGVYALLIFFAAVMNFRAARDSGQLNPVLHAMGLPILAVGLVVDTLVQVLVSPWLFLDWPREWTVSDHIKRLVNGPTGWRRTFALWWAVKVLNPLSINSPHIPIPLALQAPVVKS